MACFLGLCEERSEVIAWVEKGLEAGEKSNNFESIAMTLDLDDAEDYARAYARSNLDVECSLFLEEVIGCLNLL